MKPHVSFLVCTLARSGSGLLCDALWNTGLAGKPDEYFNPDTVNKHLRTNKSNDYIDYLNKILNENSTENKVFGAKLMWDDFFFLKGKISTIKSFSHLKISDSMNILFPNLHYIWIRRQDKIKQAISLWKMYKTGIPTWRNDRPLSYKIPLEFNFKKIKTLVNQLTEDEQNWQNYFANNRIKPFIITYEKDLEHSYKNTIKRTLEYLNIPVPENLILWTKYKKQSDKLSEEFEKLYYKELKNKISRS